MEATDLPLGALPEGWAEATMGDVAEVIGGGTPSTKEPRYFCESGGVPWLTPADLSDFAGVFVRRGTRSLTAAGLRASSARLLPPGAVLMSSRAPIGYLAVASNEISTNQGFKSFVLRNGLVPEYVFFWLKFAMPLIQEMGSGSTFAEISGAKARLIPVRIAPMAEQRRIVARIEALGESLDRARNRLANLPPMLKRLRQAVLEAACSGKFTATGREQRFPSVDELVAFLGAETVPEEDRPEADIPPTWRWVAAQDLCDRARPITYGVIKLGQPARNGVPTLRSSDVRRLFIDESDIKSIARDIAKEYARTYLQGGEVLVTVRGSLGGVAVVPVRMAGFNVSREVAVLPIRQPVNPDYVAYAIASRTSQAWLANRARGVAYTGINISDLRRLPLPLPPAEEQSAIVRVVRRLLLLADRAEERVRTGVARAETVPNAILSKAFSGKLVVSEAELATSEGRGYESARALLERLERERGALASNAGPASAGRPGSRSAGTFRSRAL